MLQWMFGSKSEDKPKTQNKEGVDNTWAVEYLGQYLNSPLWRTPVLNFLQNNCVIFQDSEQNPFEYTQVFKNFTNLISGLIEGVMREVGISEELMEECIVKGLKTKKRKLFQQLLVCDNFLAFKKVMIKKNKEFEIQALKQLAKEDSNLHAEQKKIEKDLQRIQIQKAIALSQALASKLDEEQQKMIQQALKQSAKEQQERQLKIAKEQKKQQYSKLPPLNTHKPVAFGSSLLVQKPLQQLVKDRQTIIQQTKKIQIKQVPVEDAEERKKRFTQQRQLIKAKNQEKRKEELIEFLAGKPQQKPKQQAIVEEKISEQQLLRRKNLAKKLKGQLGL